MAFSSEPMHFDILLWINVSRPAFQRMVVRQSVSGRHSLIGATQVEQNMCLNGVDVRNRGRGVDALEQFGSHTWWKIATAWLVTGNIRRRRVDRIVDIPLVEILPKKNAHEPRLTNEIRCLFTQSGMSEDIGSVEMTGLRMTAAVKISGNCPMTKGLQ
jgi:hypothetical protein